MAARNREHVRDEYRSELIAAVQRAGAAVAELSPEETAAIRRSVEARYFQGTTSEYFPWEHLGDCVSVHRPDAWEWVSEFTTGHKTILLLDYWPDASAFGFEDGSKVSEVLGDSYWSEFYATNRAAEYLICFNHHDVLIAAGSAKEWLQGRVGA